MLSVRESTDQDMFVYPLEWVGFLEQRDAGNAVAVDLWDEIRVVEAPAYFRDRFGEVDRVDVVVVEAVDLLAGFETKTDDGRCIVAGAASVIGSEGVGEAGSGMAIEDVAVGPVDTPTIGLNPPNIPEKTPTGENECVGD